MHSTTLPSYVTSRVMQRRGRMHVFETIDPSKTALIVVDMQNAFCKPGVILEVVKARDIVDNINRLADGFRAAGGQVVWVQMGIESLESWPVFLGDVVPPGAAMDRILADLQPGSEGYELWPGMQTQPGDWFVPKNRFSAFLPSACDLSKRLKAEGIDTVVITGTLTNVCCESSARDAAMQDFKVVMVSDGNATHTDDAHIATLSTFIQSFGDVRSTSELVGLLTPVAAETVQD